MVAPMAEQRSNEWANDRVGKITASRMAAVLARGKKAPHEPLQAYRDYMAELVCERLTGEARGIPMATPMQWGVDCEPAARAAYEVRRGVVVQQVGFLKHPTVPYVGCSPDGLVGADGGGEIKCPFNSIVHIETLLSGTIPEDHVPQVQTALWVTGRKWWDFISYDPRMPAHLQLFISRVAPDPQYFAQLAAACKELNERVEQMVEDLQKLPKAA